MLQDAEEVQCIRVPCIRLKYLAIQPLRLIQPSRLMMRQCGGEQLLSA
jgi:hypothetical protein